jgi:uncharacterized protein (DUF4415 family)
MRKNGNFVRYSAEELARLKSHADWRKVAETTPEEIERQAVEDEGPLPEGWERSVVVGAPEPKHSVRIHVDGSVLRWFKHQGPGYAARMNAVLRAFVTARQREETAEAGQAEK